MKVLLIGGAGAVGSYLSTHLSARHRVWVLDRAAPDNPDNWGPPNGGRVTYLEGDAREPSDVRGAVQGCDVVVHLAGVVPGNRDESDDADVQQAFAVNVASVHLALQVAARAGVARLIHISSMSVFHRYGRVPVDVIQPPDAAEPYGLTKRLAEEVCRSSENLPGLGVCSLRLAFPTPDADWPLWRPPQDRQEPTLRTLDDGTPLHALSASDLAGGLEAAIDYSGPYRTFCLLGDDDGRSVIGDDTASVLGWRPTRRMSR
ncbi:MAG TPA: NAD(P)-dependent oxidoreductase [Jiangellaceae bacterium]|nr:NAD(P)-dependent oxidoreductase [Jiangellaceae bacterium]